MFNKIIKRIIFIIKRLYHEQFVFKLYNQEKIFSKIYINNYWSSSISKSGPGSDVNNTKRVRKNLPKIIKKYKIRSVFDAPCGDFYWFNKIIFNMKIRYIGADIVKELIRNNQKKYGNRKIRFMKMNLVNSNYPKTDLWICRALFFHLDYNSILKILSNLRNSKIKYVLLTNSNTKEKFKNKDIRTGNYRQLDLFKKPFNFKKNYILKFDDTFFPNSNQLDQEMILWKKKDLIQNLKFFK